MKNTKRLLFSLVFILSSLMIQAGPGDTIMVQTFEFEGYPVGEGWLSPREGFFDFTEIAGLEFEKVFIHYTLKCDQSQNPACGEWDYISYIKVMDHTGLGEFPSYIVGGVGGYTPVEYPYMNDVSWKYEPRFEETIVFDDPTSVTEYEIGDGNIIMSNPFNGSLNDSRNYYIYTADELLMAGLTAGNITGMQFNVNSVGDEMKRLTIRIKETLDLELTNHMDDEGFEVVYSKDTQFTEVGWQNFDFTNYFSWDGTSSIIVDLYFDGGVGNDATEVVGTHFTDWNCASSSTETDNVLDFNGPDVIGIDKSNLASIDQEVTVSFWLNGNPEQPQNDHVFEARDAEGNRVLNTHLPWSNGRIYWDAGNETGYDRIDKEADNPEQYKGKWNHWALTKNVGTGEMKIYFNGELWHSGTDLTRNIGAIDTIVIGRGMGNSNNFYDGKLDEFRIWSKELDEGTIAEWMYKDVDANHPDYGNLLAYYKFNETDGYNVIDEITSETAALRGIPQRMGYKGKRSKGFVVSDTRPNVKFNRNVSFYQINTELVVDSVPFGEVMIEMYTQLSAGEKPVLDETIYVYPAYYNNYVYDENGIAIDSTYVTPDEVLNLEMIEYLTDVQGEEIVIPWEVGRFITPYGNNLSLDDDGWTWIYDVTDFQHLLQGDNVHMRAGNFQELLDLKVYFVEGTPPRDLLGIENLYSVNPQLSNFDEIVIDTTVTLMPEANMFKLKTTLSGHWFGEGNNCAEFCPNIHSVDVNGNQEFSWQVIQECGENPLFPQGGTWFYDRAGWCPGMPVTEQNLDLTPFIDVGNDTEVVVDYDVQYDPYGNYVTEIFFVSYDEPNFSNDASIEEIIAPSTFKLNTRFNPICSNPMIRIKNTGIEELTSLTIAFGITDQQTYNFDWIGNLGFLEEEVVQLPTIDLTDFNNSGSLEFSATISEPNGLADEYEYNNENHSSFDLVTQYDQQLIILFKTNNRPWENNYEIYDTDGEIVYSRDNFAANTIYWDTLNLSPGCYEFVAYDTGGDGMNDWPSNYGNGFIKFMDFELNTLVSLERWFGEYIRYNFVYTDESTGMPPTEEPTAFNIWPNPSEGKFSLELLTGVGEYQIEVLNVTGEIVFKDRINSSSHETYKLDLSKLGNGLYLVNVRSANINAIKKIIIER